MHGSSNIGKLDNHQLKFLFNAHVICLNETWLTNKKLPIFKKFENFNIFQCPATKDKTRGRASGGLTIIIKKTLNANIIDSSQDWIFLKINNNYKFLIGLVYFPPTKDHLHLFELFQVTLLNIIEQHPTHPIYVGGDFNSRVGELNEGLDHIFEETQLLPKRFSKDKTVNTKKRNLCEILEDLGMTLINGRSMSDNPAQYTYIYQPVR